MTRRPKNHLNAENATKPARTFLAGRILPKSPVASAQVGWDGSRRPLTIDAVQGNDLTVSGVPSGPVPANPPVALRVTFDEAMTSGQDYKGQLLLGPSTAPTAVTVPITVHRQ